MNETTTPEIPRGLNCVCGEVARIVTISSRLGRQTRIYCPHCERATKWLLTATNGEERTELLYLWDVLKANEIGIKAEG